MKMKFYGVRGSIPTPGLNTVRYGGNTPCVEIRDDQTELILDAGTGIRELGNDLMKKLPPPKKIEAYLFLSHTHWDHIQGFPFFVPAYIKGNKFDIYGEKKVDTDLEKTLAGQMLYQYFPVSLKQLKAQIEFHDIVEGDTIEIPQFKIKNIKSNHPYPGVFSYSIECGDRKVVYATDTEHYDCIDSKLLNLADHADALIYDAQYTPEEYKNKHSWGHSTAQKGIELAKEAKSMRLILFHHDPMHTDKDIDGILETNRKIAGKDLDVIAAYEGLCLEL